MISHPSIQNGWLFYNNTRIRLSCVTNYYVCKTEYACYSEIHLGACVINCSDQEVCDLLDSYFGSTPDTSEQARRAASEANQRREQTADVIKQADVSKPESIERQQTRSAADLR